jgi:hypothetical protein
MKRRVIKQGLGGYTLSLPVGWVRKNNIDFGQELDVDENKGNLVISTERKKIDNKFSINVDKLKTKTIQEIIMCCYFDGVNEIEITYSDINKKGFLPYLKKEIKKGYKFSDLSIEKKTTIPELVEDSARKLIGYEVVDQTENKIVIKQVSGVSEEDITVTLRRIFRILESLNELILETLKGQKLDLYLLMSKVENFKKFTYYSVRLLKNSNIEKKSLWYQTIVRELNNVGHIYRFLAIFVNSHKIKASKDTIKIIENLGDMIRLAHKSFFKFDYEHHNEFNDLIGRTYKINNDLYSKGHKKDIKVAQSLAFCAKGLKIVSMQILGMNLAEQK